MLCRRLNVATGLSGICGTSACLARARLLAVLFLVLWFFFSYGGCRWLLNGKYQRRTVCRARQILTCQCQGSWRFELHVTAVGAHREAFLQYRFAVEQKAPLLTVGSSEKTDYAKKFGFGSDRGRQRRRLAGEQYMFAARHQAGTEQIGVGFAFVQRFIGEALKRLGITQLIDTEHQ